MQSNTSAENLNIIIAGNLKKLRKDKGLTLDDVAELTGVSKSMLGQIEREESTPSVAILWKISTGLKISFTALMIEEKEEVEIIDNTSVTPLTNGSNAFQLYPVFPFEPGRNFEILHIEMQQGAVSNSLPHDSGTEEFVLVYEGEMTLQVGEKTYVIKKGQSIRYKADQKHGYANDGNTLVRLCMVIYYA